MSCINSSINSRLVLPYLVGCAETHLTFQKISSKSRRLGLHQHSHANSHANPHVNPHQGAQVQKGACRYSRPTTRRRSGSGKILATCGG
jgi:hypothetical protein